MELNHPDMSVSGSALIASAELRNESHTSGEGGGGVEILGLTQSGLHVCPYH